MSGAAKRDYLFGEPKNACQLTVDAVADLSGIPAEEIMGRRRVADVVFARHAAMYLMRKANRSYPQIGLWFNRDHTTIMHAVRQVEAAPQLYPIGEVSE